MVEEVLTPLKVEKKELKPKLRRRVDYEACLKMLYEHGGFFIQDISRQTAWYVKKVLSRRTGRVVEATPYALRSKGRLLDGYLFGFVSSANGFGEQS